MLNAKICAVPRNTAVLAACVLASTWVAHAPAAQPGALDSVAMPPAGECLSVLDKGADAKGGKDSAGAFQQAIDAAAGKKVCVPAGTYRIGQRLSMKPGTHLVMHRNAVIANAAQVGGGNSALIQSESFTTKTNRVTIEGGTFTSVSTMGKFGGRVIGWYGDNWTVKNVVIRDWAQDGKPARAINAVGDKIEILQNTIRGPGCKHGCAGIMIGGGEGFLVAQNHVLAGDDGIGLFPAANPNNPHFNMPIRNARIENNVSVSTDARILAIGLHYLKEVSETPMDTTVEGIHVKGLTGSVTNGKPGAMALLVENMTPRGIVRNVVLDDVHIVKTATMGDGFKFLRAGGGQLSGITLQNSSYTGTCLSAAVKVVGVTDVVLKSNRIVAPPGCANAILVDKSSRNVSLDRNQVQGKVSGK